MNIFMIPSALLIATTALVSSSIAATPLERAGELKTWKEQCNDGDPELRLAYVEAALDTNDVSVQRICTRLALESDDANTRNLGLRAVMASLDRVLFETTIPAPYKAALEDAEGNEKRLEEIRNWYFYGLWNFANEGVNFEISKSKVTSGKSVWYPLTSLAEVSDNYKGNANVVGSTVSWTGKMRFGNRAWSCRLDASLESGATLAGMLKCEDFWPIPVRAKLL